MSVDSPKTLPLLSLRNLVLFPGAVMPVEIGRASSLRLIEALGGKGARVLVGTQKDADIEEPAGAENVADLSPRCLFLPGVGDQTCQPGASLPHEGHRRLEVTGGDAV